MMPNKQTYSPCDDCQYSFSKNNQESNMCKICEFRQLLNRLTADVAPKSEVEELQAENENLKKALQVELNTVESLSKSNRELSKAMQCVEGKIFAEIEKFIPQFEVGYFSYDSLTEGIAELKKKYTEEKT